MTNIWILQFFLTFTTNGFSPPCVVQMCPPVGYGIWYEPGELLLEFYAPTSGVFALQAKTDTMGCWGMLSNRWSLPGGTNDVRLTFPPWGLYDLGGSQSNHSNAVWARVVGLSGPVTNFPSYYTNNTYTSDSSLVLSRFDLSSEEQGTLLQVHYEDAVKAGDPSAAVFPVKENVQNR